MTADARSSAAAALTERLRADAGLLGDELTAAELRADHGIDLDAEQIAHARRVIHSVDAGGDSDVDNSVDSVLDGQTDEALASLAHSLGAALF